MSKMTLQEFKTKADLPNGITTWEEAQVYVRELVAADEVRKRRAKELNQLRGERRELQAEVELLKMQRDETAHALGMAVVMGGLFSARRIDADNAKANEAIVERVADRLAPMPNRHQADTAAEQ